MSDEFDRYAKSYDEVLVGSMPEGFAEDGYFARYKVELMARHMRGVRVESILDFGCGIGRSFGFIRRAFPTARIAGFDASARSIEIAARGATDAELASDWSIVERRSYDCIFVANVFHHIAQGERHAWLDRCRRALSEKGRLFWFEHNPLNPLTRRVFERCPFDADATMIGRGEALSLMKAADLKVLRSGYTLFFPRPLALLRPLEPWMSLIPLGAQYYAEVTR